MDSKNNNVKRKSLLITIFSIVSAFLVGTFAWLSWRSQNTAMVLTVGEIDGLSVTLKPYQISTSLVPSNTYTNQNYVSVTATNKKNRSGNFSLFYRVTSIDEDLIDDGFKYTIVKSTDNWATQTVAKTGDFSSAVSGSNLIIYDEKIPGNNTTYQYKVYLWIDNQDSNQNQMQNKVFTGELRADFCYEPATIPKLDQGMIPVTIANNGTVTTVSENDENWYSYCDKKWANVVLVKDSGVKTRAQNKVAGTTIDRSDILAYYVWIPRYKYSIPDKIKCSEINDVNETNNPSCYEQVMCSDIPNVNYNDYPKCYNQYITEEDKNTIIAATASMYGMSIADATEMVDVYINLGKISEMVDAYNQQMDPDIEIYYNLKSDETVKIFNGDKLIDYNSLNKMINIVFESASSPKSTGTAVGTSYYTHPAFTFGTQELSGIWVGKFETTGDATTPTVLDNISSLRNQNVSTQFATAQKFGTSTYGIVSSDAHMMKNSEWGAAAYLSHSKYGVNTEVRINNNSSYTTGCGASEENGSSTSSCEIQYGNASLYPQSTTGNISGIFDMSGGAFEYVMGHWSDNLNEPSNEDSGFSTMPDAKYYDLYDSSTFDGDYNTNIQKCTLATCGGHALNETKSWYSDYASFVNSSYPWFGRGGYASNSRDAGAFYLAYYNGTSYTFHSFRSVIATR